MIEMLNAAMHKLLEAAPWILLVSGLVEFSPIKINPWGWVAKKIGKAINEDVLTRMDVLEKDVKKIHADMDETNAKNARTKILRFGDEILHGVKHSKDHFDEILLDITDYVTYCDEHPDFKNHMTETTTQLIVSTYQRCMEERSFL